VSGGRLGCSWVSVGRSLGVRDRSLRVGMRVDLMALVLNEGLWFSVTKGIIYCL
jgi:hypothetical protein